MTKSWIPSLTELWQAIEIYLGHAYAASAQPSPLQRRLDDLRVAGRMIWDNSSVERTPPGDPAPTRYALRLGNPWYPHMKLAVERAPDDASYLLRVDTHDRHIRPSPQSPDYPAFLTLQQRNQQLAADIEAAWAQAGLLTFKEYLRRDLAQRELRPVQEI